MGDIFDILKGQVEPNARNAVDTFARELFEYHKAKEDRRLYATIMDFALFIRHRTIDLARENQPLSADDLAAIASIGQERAIVGFPDTVQENVLSLHTSLMLREISVAPATHDIDGLLRMVGWFSTQATVARDSYLLGYEKGRAGRLPIGERVQMCARKLLADDPGAPQFVRSLQMPLPGHYTVTVIRISGSPRPSGDLSHAALIEALLPRHHIPMAWQRPDTFVALVPGDDIDPSSASQSALSIAQDFADATGRPCAAGAATGPVGTLAETVAIAWRVSQAAPAAAVPPHVPTTADLFVEMALAQQPRLDHWLRDLTKPLADGPDLVATLEAYYRTDMNRLRTAAALFIHPRTLDYRLQRVRELTGVNPGSTQGVRILSTAVSRLRAGAWG